MDLQRRESAGEAQLDRMADSDKPGLIAARLLDYYMQNRRPELKIHRTLDQIKAARHYKIYKSHFDRLTKIFRKYGLNLEKYIVFFVNVQYCRESDIKDIDSNLMFNRYITKLQTAKKYGKIYGWFMKSAENVADICIGNGFTCAKDGMSYILKNKLLGNFVLAGTITRYYLAAIKNFDKIICKLDPFTREELDDLYKRFDIYSTEVNNACMKMKSMKPNVFSVTDAIIERKIEEKNLSSWSEKPGEVK